MVWIVKDTDKDSRLVKNYLSTWEMWDFWTSKNSHIMNKKTLQNLLKGWKII